jgi:hypothetical protein
MPAYARRRGTAKIALGKGTWPEAQRMEGQRPWQRLFGLTWTDFFTGLPVTVAMEKDLALKKQLLDVLLLRTEAELLNCRLPDGFEDLARYNLVTFKSHAEKLSLWTLYELVGHDVNLRKQVSPAMDEDELLPEEQFRLYAVSARYPQQLAAQLGAALRPILAGVYEADVWGLGLRIVVPNQLPEAEHNALLHLFSTRGELLAYGGRHYHIHSRDASTLLLQLFRRVRREIGAMSSALQEFHRESADELLKELSVEKRLEGLSADQILRVVPIKKLLESLSPEQRVQGLSAEELFELAKKLKGNGASGETIEHPPK